MSWLLLLLVSSSALVASSLADPGVDTANEIHGTPEGDAAEGRLCTNCGGKLSGYSSDNLGHGSSSSSSSGYGGTVSSQGLYDFSSLGGLGGLEGLEGLGGLGLGGASLGLSSLLSKGTSLSYGMFALPLIGINIAILVLLGILLVHVKKLTSLADNTGTGDVYHYAAAGPAFPGASTYQSYDSGYHRRSTEEGRSMDSPSTFQYFTQLVLDAIDKYGEMETEAEK